MANDKKARAAAADSSLDKVTDYRFPEATHRSNSPAKIAATECTSDRDRRQRLPNSGGVRGEIRL
jgi:hypothetical protein